MNLLLGSHQDAMALGPIDRLWQVLNKEVTIDWLVGHVSIDDYCLVHGNDCILWPDFVSQYDIKNNLFLELAKYTGKKVFVTNNLLPTGARSQLNHPDLTVKNIYIVRDGRDIVLSYIRKNPDKTFIEGITGFLQTSFSAFQCLNDGDTSLCFSYEDVATDTTSFLKTVGDYVGLQYCKNADRYWEWGHHIVGGNPGTIATLRLAEGLEISNFIGEDFYRKQFKSMLKNGPDTFVDERGRDAISRCDLFYFDCFAGSDNSRFGYPRDTFTKEEKIHFSKLARAEIKAGNVPDYFIPQLQQYMFDNEGNKAPSGDEKVKQEKGIAQKFLTKLHKLIK